MKPSVAEFLLGKVLGWHWTESVVPEPKAVILGVPHTSIWDFVLGYLYYTAVGGNVKFLIKKEAFFWPVGPVLKRLGGVPIDRSNPSEVMLSLIHAIDAAGTFHIIICPEGTRKAVSRWKMGYHTIARQSGSAVYLGHFDFATKTIGRGPRFELTDDARADTARIQQLYEEMHLTPMHPSGYITK